MEAVFIIDSILLGIGLAMDAFSVSLANGLVEPRMRKPRMCAIAGIFGIFQFAMPLAGWACVHELVCLFSQMQKAIPWVAFILLSYIGGKMIHDSIRVKSSGGVGSISSPSDVENALSPSGNKNAPSMSGATGFGVLILQGVATSIDALSAGFATAEHTFVPALASAVIIGVVTFVICLAGLAIGKKLGMVFAPTAGTAPVSTAGTAPARKAGILGGCILIAIGLEIFIRGILA